MAYKIKSSLLILVLLNLALTAEGYTADWKSLDSRPLPEWYDDAKLGIFIHWGVFAVPSYSSEWFWWQWQGQPTPAVAQFMQANYKPDFTYGDFAKDFKTEFFQASQWTDMFKASGAKYIVFVSKHHEGYTNWPSKYSFNWNSMDVGPNRDIVGELMNATRQTTDLKFGLYHSMFEWFNPLYLSDKKSGWKTQNFVNQKTLPELYEIVNTYKPEVVWSDGDWEATDDYWKSKEFLAWLYTDSPVKDTVVVNDRWGSNVMCHHGGYYTCSDRYNPGTLQKHKFENAMTLDKYSWGYRRNAKLSDYLTMEELLQTFIITISCGGNMLMNVGPPSHGHITPIFEERLRDLGSWLNVNGEGVYGSRPWTYQNDTLTKDVWYTQNPKSKAVYAFVFHWPEEKLVLGSPKMAPDASAVTLVGFKDPITFTTTPPGITLSIPPLSVNKMPCKWMWVFKLTGVLN